MSISETVAASEVPAGAPAPDPSPVVAVAVASPVAPPVEAPLPPGFDRIYANVAGRLADPPARIKFKRDPVGQTVFSRVVEQLDLATKDNQRLAREVDRLAARIASLLAVPGR